MGKTQSLRFFRSKYFVDMLVIGGLLTSITAILLRYSSNFRFFLISFILIIGAAWTGKFVNDFSLKTTFHPGIELYFYAGIMITYLSNPWIGIAAVLISFFLTNRINALFRAVTKQEKFDTWLFAEGVRDMLHYVLLEMNMWLYIFLLLLMPKFYSLSSALFLWNLLSFASSVGDMIINKYVSLERPDAIGRAPWNRFVVYAFLFYFLSPWIVSFVREGSFYP
jgi:hypothetical protein